MEASGVAANPGEINGLGNLSRKIISIAAGEAHTLALTGDGKVYSWGRGAFGRLGTGSDGDKHLPVRVTFFGDDDEREEKLKIVGIAAGSYHSLALADDGSVWGWGWGYNTFLLDLYMDGQIGASGENYLVPHLLEGFVGLGSSGSLTKDYETKSDKPLKISSVKAGGMMSLAIGNLGGLWMWGNCPHISETKPNEGESSLVSSAAPFPVWNFHGHTVVKVACGNEHVVALVTAGERHEGGDLVCYSWGGNSHGQLGLGDKESRLQPEVLDAGDALSPLLIPCNEFGDRRFHEPLQVACGAAHTVVLGDGGYKHWSWGRGRSGVLGNGNTIDFYVPTVVLWPRLNQDFEEEKPKNVSTDESNKRINPDESLAMEKRLFAAMEEMKLLQSRLSVMERYAGILHGSIFGKPFQEHDIPSSLRNFGTFDIAKEWDNMLESSDHNKLIRMDMFYHDMLSGVKDKLMKRRIQEIVKDCLKSSASKTSE